MISAELRIKPHARDCIMPHRGCCPRYYWLTEAGEKIDVQDLTPGLAQRKLEKVARRTRQKLGRLEASIKTIGE